MQMEKIDKQEQYKTKEQEYQQKIAQLKKEKEELKQQYNEKLKQYVVQSALKQAGGRNTKALLALVELQDIVLNEDGTVEGLDIKKLKREVPYLFEEENKKIEGTGYYSTNKKVDKKSEAAKQFQTALMRR